MTRYPDLDPFAIPLRGITLIEASAGTGKTWNITSLYLRLLLEQGLGVENILVVTFTVAATEELRERIRGRLLEALECLEGAGGAGDPALAGWLRQRGRREEDARLLKAALAGMDGAAVFTIHGFCQRMLSEHAFDSGLVFDLEFIESEEPLRLRAVRDFWRRWFVGERLPPPLAQWLLERYRTPESLLLAISPRLEERPRLLPGTPPLEAVAGALEKKLETLAQAHGRFRSAWERHGREAVEILRTHAALNRQTYNAGAVAKAVAAAEHLHRSEAVPLRSCEKQELLCADFMAGRLRKNAAAPRNPLFQAAENLAHAQRSLVPDLEQLRVAFEKAARAFVREQVEAAKEASHQLYFSDLLLRMDRSLQGEAGDRFARHLRRRFPMALIDEFQDTDAVQYRIFRAIYGAQSEGTGLCLIGDPKQAIYGFRGGDIFAYLAAVRDAGQRYSLGTNWRSGSRLVRAVNLLFGSRQDPFLQKEIGYRPVAASPAADERPLRVAGREPAPLQFWKLSPRQDKAARRADGRTGALRTDDGRQVAAALVAGHIAGLLQPGKSTLGDRPLRAADIAILVRRHQDTPLVQEALRQQGIASVTLSDESVFSSEEARQLQHLLQALIHCEDERLLRHALADRLLGRSARQIDALLEDDAAWENLQQRFFGYRELWRERGFIQAFQQLFQDEGIAGRLLAQAGGERRLTNLLQLVELLQQAARIRPGMEELLRWLKEERDLAGRYEEARLRLESDEELVKIVTMHASKGLEYPVVYIPFPWAEGGGKREPPWYYHDADGRPCLHLGGGDEPLQAEARRRQQQEELAERLRLLYVSVTRAARLCVLTWGRVNRAGNSALAWLLYPDEQERGGLEKLDEGRLFEPLEALAAASDGAIEVKEPPPPAARLPERREKARQPGPRPFAAAIDGRWRVSSYSGLVRGRESHLPDFDAVTGAGAPPAGDPVQGLPAGSEFGLFLHALLEELDFADATLPRLRALVLRLARRHGLPELQEQGLEPMLAMLGNLLDTSLPEAETTLRQVGRGDRLDEMEFHFSVAGAAPGSLQRLLRRFPQWRQAADGLNFPAFRGLMHGFIDLVFRHRGRYYLVDYKSNRLDDYGAQGLERAMAVHHYPLQGLIYALALHRHLRQRLPGYRAEQHLGGVFYLFVRGMRPGSREGIWFRRPGPGLLEALDRYFGGGEAHG